MEGFPSSDYEKKVDVVCIDDIEDNFLLEALKDHEEGNESGINEIMDQIKGTLQGFLSGKRQGGSILRNESLINTNMRGSSNLEEDVNKGN